MTIFGSYQSKDRSLTGEALWIMSLDTFVAIMAGLIIFPACFAFSVAPNSGPGLIFITLPNIFNAMDGGILWCVTELVSKAQLDKAVSIVKEVLK
jgi:NSS family neurotransmitter:Na+ symporter